MLAALLDESSYSPHSIIGINEPPSSQVPEALWSIKALSSQMVNLRQRGNFREREWLCWHPLSAIPCPCRTEEKSSTRGWLGCSSELCHKSNWTFLNICCGWLAPWLAEFDRREWKPVCLRVLCVCTQSLADSRMGILDIYFLTFFFFFSKRNKLLFETNSLSTKHVPGNYWHSPMGVIISRSHFVFP